MRRLECRQRILAMFEFTMWHASFLDFLISLRHCTVIGKQLFISNERKKTGFAE
jgi:hypothetical protein